MRFLYFCMALAAVPAAAQDLPALYGVTGVAENDVLNVRSEPSGSAAKLGELAPGATGIEVTEVLPDESWARINLGETAGWVAMRYLAREPGPDWHAMQSPLSCYGNEPFWNAFIPADGGPMILNVMDGGEAMGFGRTVTSPAFDWPRTVGFALQGPGREGFAVIRAEGCTDGMSDRMMGLTFNMFLAGPHGTEAYQGCCRLQE
ncbi:MAG: SH3 domain-containing protein [Hyphomicrobiales bacterium]|nr:SH3 domain-containing protein [Hyphomicrobiales bacterium]